MKDPSKVDNSKQQQELLPIKPLQLPFILPISHHVQKNANVSHLLKQANSENFGPWVVVEVI